MFLASENMEEKYYGYNSQGPRYRELKLRLPKQYFDYV
jgi:hypothetical protein